MSNQLGKIPVGQRPRAMRVMVKMSYRWTILALVVFGSVGAPARAQNGTGLWRWLGFGWGDGYHVYDRVGMYQTGASPRPAVPTPAPARDPSLTEPVVPLQNPQTWSPDPLVPPRHPAAGSPSSPTREPPITAPFIERSDTSAKPAPPALTGSPASAHVVYPRTHAPWALHVWTGPR